MQCTFLVPLLLLLYAVGGLWLALRHGKMSVNRISSTPITREDDPLQFWGGIALHIALGILAIIALVSLASP